MPWVGAGGRLSQLEITAAPHGGITARGSRCLQPALGYDRLAERTGLFVSLWGIVTWSDRSARRITCPESGVGGRAWSLEPWQTTDDPRHDVLPFALGAVVFVAREGVGLSHQLGM